MDDPYKRPPFAYVNKLTEWKTNIAAIDEAARYEKPAVESDRQEAIPRLLYRWLFSFFSPPTQKKLAGKRVRNAIRCLSGSGSVRIGKH